MKKEVTINDVIALIEAVRAELKASFESQIGTLHSEIGTELGTLRSEIGTELDTLRSEIGTELGTLRSEIGTTRLELLQHIDALHENLSEFQKETRTSLRDLQEGAFTKEEKEEVLVMTHHYDNWLEQDTLGKGRITLEREEYDSAALARGFPNRFQAVAT